ncbi:Membrane protein [Tenacibaculum maritimum]|nr:Membrane protein [Tenacibaculum maritimum]CAA0230143.1 conserved membrane hypothetical protein [Tenacibaculum maritimum]
MRQEWIQKRSNRLLVDSIIAILVIISPVIFYSYLSFPQAKTWETFLFTYESKYYEDVFTFMWVFLGKFVWFYLSLIWYFTNKNWWKHAVLIPIGMSLYQIIILLNDDIKFKDEAFDKLFLIPFVIFICLILIYLREKVSFYSKALDLKDEFEKMKEKITLKEINS